MSVKREDLTLSKISYLRASVIFLGFTVYFYLLVLFVIPWLKIHFIMNPAMYWFITGYCLFTPMLATAVLLARREGRSSVRDALAVRPLRGKDWTYALAGTLLCFVFTGLIVAVARVASTILGTRPIDPTPWFMAFEPFSGTQRLLLLVWLPMFCLNILGEELLWRGYIQSRLIGRFSWLAISTLWLLFHIPFGIDLMIILLPIMVILPYAVHKTSNTTVGIAIHALYNGPTFVLVALGLVA